MFFSLKDNPFLLKKCSELANVLHKPSVKAALIRNIDHGEWYADLSMQVDNSARSAILASEIFGNHKRLP